MFAHFLVVGEFPCKFFHTGLPCYAGEKCKFKHEGLADGLEHVVERVCHACLNRLNFTV